MKKLIQIPFYYFLIFLVFSCENSKWKKVEIISPDKNDTISVITIDYERYIYNGNSNEIPKDDYAVVDISDVTDLGDEIGICWNKDGYKWKLVSFYSGSVTNNLDKDKYWVGKDTVVDERGIPNREEYFGENCVVIYLKDEIIRPKDGADIRYK